MIRIESIQSYVESAVRASAVADRPRLFVLGGFPFGAIKMTIPYLFTRRCASLDEYFDKAERRRMVSEAVARGNREEEAWCRLEDYALLEAKVLEEFFALRFIKSPIYRNLLPFDIDLGAYGAEPSPEEEECASECLVPVFFDEARAKELDSRLGQVYRGGGACWYTVPFPVPWQESKAPRLKEMPEDHDSEFQFTITEDEGSWALLCWRLMTEIPAASSVGINISNEVLRAAYADLVARLGDFARNPVSLKLEEAAASRRHGYDSEGIIQKYWRVSGFRDFLVYRNVRSSSGVKVEEVSQADVIEDILTQVDNALSGQSYRDIFVTAPTGSGKSVMFQVPAIILHERRMLTLVISPLIALMNDQVYSLSGKGLGIAATINSSVSLSEKEVIIARVQSGEVSVLYLSPESLLSRADIRTLIGDRVVGLIVVDEAHIVTTWGKAFRPDYWYLGNYIQRLRKEHRFPIATFTATAIYRGPEDMYSETRDSLGMRDPITYFGHIPRKNIDVSFARSEGHAGAKTSEYNEVKFSVLASRLEEFKAAGKKTLVYFPFVSLINDFDIFLSGHETGLSTSDLVRYHGGMAQIDKKESFQRYKSNECRIMLATKAFGMGIDIPDIDAVYHFAPTGNVCDYVQEIGRAARDERIRGLAKFDYLPKDFSFVNRLHGISTIRKSQLLAVMRKLLDIGAANGYRRNLLVSSDDFYLIFNEGGRYSDKDGDNLDNKLKTALLIIEKDLVMKLGYSPIVARPRALFTYAFFRADGDRGASEMSRVFGRHCEDIGECTKVNLKAFWEANYPKYSFPKLKYDLYNDPTAFGFSRKESIAPVVVIDVAHDGGDNEISEDRLIDAILSFCDGYAQSGKYFKVNAVEAHLKACFIAIERVKTNLLSEAVVAFLEVWNRNIALNNGRFLSFREDLGYRIMGAGYIDVRDFWSSLDLSVGKRFFVDSSQSGLSRLRKTFALLSLLDTAGCLTYTVQGGENPEIFIRINSYYQLQNISRDYDGYDNMILNNVKMRHENSVKMLDYLFIKVGDRTDRFWAIIEAYFLGFQPDFDKDIDQELPHVERLTHPHARLLARHE
ncbi:MAG TPA: DEAD/DEAH box helicase [Rectinemataceae bacterium]|nr:DEAD/DEAH box helicase [Rectinemataceae bacterium]